MLVLPRKWLIVYFVLLVVVFFGGSWFLQHEKEQIRHQVTDQLESIAQLKIRQIQQWRSERLGDAQVTVAAPFVSDMIAEWLSKPAAEMTTELLGWFQSLQKNYQYSDIILLDSTGTIRLSLTQHPLVNEEIQKQITTAVRLKKVLLSDLHKFSVLPPHQDVISPFFKRSHGADVHVGTLLLRIDASTFLYPMLQSWPVESRSAETLLVQRIGEEVVFLSELRHQRESGLTLRLPLNQPELPAARVLQGQRGVVSGLDYRSVPVVAVGYPVQGTNWFMISKVDTKEVLSEWRVQAIYIEVLIVGVVVVLTTVLAMMWMRARKEQYKLALKTEVEQRRIEAHILRTTNLLERAETMANMGCWEFDFSSKMVWASPSARHIYGVSNETWTIDEIQGIPLLQYRSTLNRALKELVQDGIPYDVEFQIRRPADGVLLDIRSQAEYNAEANKVFGIIQDITERKRAEAEIRESESRYRSLFQNNHAVMLLVNPESGEVVDANPAAVKFYGWSREQLLQKKISEINALASDEIASAMQEAQETERHVFSFRHCKADGSICDVEVISGPIRIGGQERLYSIVQDVSYRRKAQEQKERLQEQLLQAQKLESVGRLAGGVAHDLNNLLSPILGYSEVLQTELEAGSTHYGYIETVHQAALRARDLVRQLLAFGRKQTLFMENADINQTVQAFVPLLRRTIREDIAIELELSAPLPSVRMDVGQIEQVLMNLVVNAQDAMPDGGSILLETETVELDQDYADSHADVRPGPHVQLSVSDTGCGMSQEVRGQIFQPFFTTKEDSQGTGLGLATSYGIVKQHGGHIWVYSEPGEGTTFKIYFPVVKQGGEVQPLPKLEAEIERDNSGCIMVVEDNEMVRELAVDILRRSGYTVYEAASGHECLEQLREKAADSDLLLTDVVMPMMNGKALYTEAKKMIPGLKVLYMSGYTENVIASRGVLDAGIDFISKPFRPTALVEKVQEIFTGR
ncbi:PAS domain S-box protein [Desulfobulbus rhabdoformis]|uniref:ATP-binding protein n=1 Tax=Desulfobulbus rhabdoformis TaxID=34032 RepID=UPI0019668C41|nr:ATP-binding protein [Desulfobulbus rhabdoformis]MBM9613711.1 PAS domain S-box protein [Desulfobulbus rhabdoformis]